MRIGIFTDAHYSSQTLSCGKRFNSQSFKKMQRAYDFFSEKRCELIVCLGDLIDTEPTAKREIENLKAIATILHSSPIPTVCVMGNHDAFVMTPQDFYSALDLQPPRDVYRHNRNLIFLDACYFKSGAHYAPGDSDWRDSYLPDEEDLQRRLGNAEGKTYLFLHQNIDPSIKKDYRIGNADAIAKILCQSGKDITVFQGHYHKGAESQQDGITYSTLPAMCESENGFWIFDL